MTCRRTHFERRGIILPLALLVLGLLTVLAAQVVFRSNADIAAVQASDAALKARMAAEAGVQKVIAILQGSPSGDSAQQAQPRGRMNMDAWYNNPDYYYGQIVSGAISGSSSGVAGDTPPAKPSYNNPATWRFSVVASDPLAQAGDNKTVRYGITDEASKLNINTATSAQLLRLIGFAVRNQQGGADDLVKAILYWRTKVKEGEEDQSEEAYYQSLEHPYVPKHGPFDSVEELLLVRGVTGSVLFGEDWNRNGMLDANENDSDGSFPPDNGDGQLDRGLYPFLTVWSSEPNTSNLNKPRKYVNDGKAVALLNNLGPGYTDGEKAAIMVAKQKPGGLKTPLDVYLNGPDDGTGFATDDLPRVLDELSTDKGKTLTGRVNVNTAPVEVLVAVGFTEDEAHRIVAMRGSLAGQDKMTLAWLIQQGVVDMERLGDAKLFNCLTTRSYQFRVESIGFADHVGTFCRLEVVIKMQGRTCQIAQWRDLSSLGLGWPVHGQEGSIAGNRHG